MYLNEYLEKINSKENYFTGKNEDFKSFLNSIDLNSKKDLDKAADLLFKKTKNQKNNLSLFQKEIREKIINLSEVLNNLEDLEKLKKNLIKKINSSIKDLSSSVEKEDQKNIDLKSLIEKIESVKTWEKRKKILKLFPRILLNKRQLGYYLYNKENIPEACENYFEKLALLILKREVGNKTVSDRMSDSEKKKRVSSIVLKLKNGTIPGLGKFILKHFNTEQIIKIIPDLKKII